jgi:hypothetical protein
VPRVSAFPQAVIGDAGGEQCIAGRGSPSEDVADQGWRVLDWNKKNVGLGDREPENPSVRPVFRKRELGPTYE